MNNRYRFSKKIDAPERSEGFVHERSEVQSRREADAESQSDYPGL